MVVAALLSMVVLLLMAGFAQAQDPLLDAGSIKSKIIISNQVEFSYAGPNYDVKSAQGKLSWYPKSNWLQRVESISMDPVGTVDDDVIYYSWEDPASKESISVTGIVNTKNSIVPVRQKIAFPLEHIPSEAMEYLGDEQIIDQTPEIKALAQELAQGKSDAYEVVYSLADWTTKNVNYSLASLGQPAIQKSSEVLSSRYGKCDEMTALFISMNRALGIPARFVAGYSYSNSDTFRKGWGGHGWAEVWLPNQGWVPFDVTYGEYGYLDATHIALKVSKDAKENSIEYSARGSDFELETSPLDITVTPLDIKKSTDEVIDISLDAPYKNVGFGSSVLILAKVKNNKDYYVSTRLDMARTTSSEQLSATYQNILLRPYEEKTVPFLIKIDSGLMQGYKYDFPFKVYSRIGPSATIMITAAQGNSYYDTSVFSEQFEQLSELSRTLPFYVVCEQGDPVYSGQKYSQSCMTNETIVEVCKLDKGKTSSCFRPELHDGRFNVSSDSQTLGVSTSSYIAKNGRGDIVKFFATKKVVDHLKLNVAMSGPTQADVDDVVSIKIDVNYTGAAPKNMSIMLSTRHATAEQQIEDTSTIPVLMFTIPARALRPGDNEILLNISYYDELGTYGEVQSSEHVVQTGATFIDKTIFMVEDVGYWINDLFVN